MDEIKRKWWDIIKALPYDNGPSSTRWVYLCAAATIAMVITMLTFTVCLVYIRNNDHFVSPTMAALIIPSIIAFIGFAGHSQDAMHKLAAETDSPNSGLKQ